MSEPNPTPPEEAIPSNHSSAADLTSPDPSSKENAEHFPHTVALLKSRQSASPAPASAENSPEKERVGGDEADQEESPSPSKNRSARRGPGAHSRAALAQRAQERLEHAKERREALRIARTEQLRRIEQQRQAKVNLQRDMRRQAFDRFRKEGPALLTQLSAAGLTLPAPGVSLDPNVIQHILVTDPRVCSICKDGPGIYNRVCPTTNKPHRRRLVLCAEKFLKLVGETRVNLVPRRDVVGEAAVAVSSAKARRGISVNPQVFMLAYYTAASSEDDPETDPVLRASACHLIELIDQLKAAICGGGEAEGEGAPADETTIKPLLLAFAKQWRQYAKLSQEELTGGDRDVAVKELIDGTVKAAIVVHQHIAQVSADATMTEDTKATTVRALQQYADMLRSRLKAVGGDDAVQQLTTGLEAAAATPAGQTEEEGSSNKKPTLALPQEEEFSAPEEGEGHVGSAPPPASPVHPPAPVLPKGTIETSFATSTGTGGGGGYTSYTSGSETDVGRPTRHREPMGPQLPPRWYVDEHGISRPPSKEDEAREQYKVLEHRAKTAYDVRLPVLKNSSQGYVDEVDEAKKKLAVALEEQAWRNFKTELSQSPPNVRRVPQMLRQVCDRLIEAVPRRLQQRLGQEIRDVLDWDMLKYRMADPKHLVELMKYVVRKVCEYGAPAREEELNAKATSFADRLIKQEELLGVTVAEMFQFLLDAIKQLREDVSQFQLTMLSSEIAKKAGEYQQHFTEMCLPPPSKWESTVGWLKHAAEECPPPTSPVSEAPERFYLKAIITHGIVGLLSSASLISETRWQHFPQESLHFDKPHIFTAANLTQLFTLRLMVVSTIHMMLAQRRVGAGVKEFLSTLDQSLVQWVSNTKTTKDGEAMTLEKLKESVLEEVNIFLAGQAAAPLPPAPTAAAAAARPNTAQLTPTDCDIIRNVLDKMVDTCSVQYATFEKRVIAAYKSIIGSKIHEDYSETLPEAFKTFATVPSLQKEVFNTAKDIRSVLEHHWETYAPFYEKLWPEIEETARQRLP